MANRKGILPAADHRDPLAYRPVEFHAIEDGDAAQSVRVTLATGEGVDVGGGDGGGLLPWQINWYMERAKREAEQRRTRKRRRDEAELIALGMLNPLK